MNKGRTTLTAVAVVGALVAAGATASPAAGATHKRRVARTSPTWVSHTKSVGNAPAKTRSTFRVYLAPQGGTAALQAAVLRVSDPKSSTYGHYLSAAQYHAKYDPTAQSAASVRTWLQQNHLKVTGTAAHRRYLSVVGTNANVEKAFSTQMKKYHHSGRTVQANNSAVAVPTGIASAILTVTGLDTSPHLARHMAPPPPASYRNARPCSRYYGQVAASTQADFKTPLPKFGGKTLPYAVCGYTGPQYRAAYENNSKYDGTGVTVAVVDAYASPTLKADAQKYGTNHGDGGYAAGQFSKNVNTPVTDVDECDGSGWYGEQSLDVESVHAMAPGANIRYYGASSCNDDALLASITEVTDENVASIITNSYGEPEEAESGELAAAYQSIFLQAGMQGQSFLFSSGDDGDELANTGNKQADASASDPFVTAVGGTSDAIGSDGKFLFQTGWGTDKYSLSTNGKSWTPNGYLYGAGGGESMLFNRPAYQNGVVPSSYGSGRAVPDVGLDGDPTTGMLVGLTQTFPDGVAYGEYRIGGTSLASPLFAGFTALRAQAAGKRVGFLNPTIYAKAGTAFNDVKGTPPDAGNVRIDFANSNDASGGLVYSVRTFNQDSSLKVKKGWDDVTGVGSPNPKWITAPAK
jgi:subtilase family serine protease